MELWIRVQKNKQLNQGLVKIEDLILEKDNANEWSIRQSCDTLAIYKTEKRALEVLDEIQNLLKPKLITKFKSDVKYNENGTPIDILIPYDAFEKSEIQELSTYIYEMPKD